MVLGIILDRLLVVHIIRLQVVESNLIIPSQLESVFNRFFSYIRSIPFCCTLFSFHSIPCIRVSFYSMCFGLLVFNSNTILAKGLVIYKVASNPSMGFGFYECINCLVLQVFHGLGALCLVL